MNEDKIPKTFGMALKKNITRKIMHDQKYVEAIRSIRVNLQFLSLIS